MHSLWPVYFALPLYGIYALSTKAKPRVGALLKTAGRNAHLIEKVPHVHISLPAFLINYASNYYLCEA